MAISPAVKKNWIEIQTKRDVPVNAIGMKIDPKDVQTLVVWREEGIDQFLRKWMSNLSPTWSVLS